MKNKLFLLALTALLGVGHADTSQTEKAQTEQSQGALEELKTQKKVLAEMRESLSEEDKKALEEDFKKKLAEIDERIAQIEASDTASTK